MEVHCEKCDRVYMLDDAFISESGTQVKCSGCKHVFTVFPWSGDDLDKAGWQIKGKNGESRPVRRISDIRELILAGQVSPDDQVSTSLGSDWKRVGDIQEMKRYFIAANPTTVGRPSSVPAVSKPPEKQPEKQPDKQPDKHNAEEPRRVPGPITRDEAEVFKPKARSRVGFWIVSIVAAAVAGAGVQFVFGAREPAKPAPVPPPKVEPVVEQNRHVEYFEKGWKYFVTDTEDSFTQADRRFHQAIAVKEDYAEALAALALMSYARAQEIRDAEIDLRMDLNIESPDKPETEDKATAKLRFEAEKSISEAAQWMESALRINPELPIANLAAAESKRLSGDFDAALAFLAKSRKNGANPGADYLQALVLIDNGGYTAQEVLSFLTKADAGETQPRVMYRKARVLAANNRADEALDILKEILKSTPEHAKSQVLVERIEDKRSISLRLEKNDVPIETDEIASAEPVREKNSSKSSAAGPIAAPRGGADSMLMKAQALQKAGNIKEAARMFNEVLYKSPSNVEALTGLGNCNLELGYKGKAIAYFNNALSMNKSFSPAVIGLAKAYQSQGKSDKALKYFKQYLSAQPNGSYADLARQTIAQLEGGTGQPDQNNQQQ